MTTEPLNTLQDIGKPDDASMQVSAPYCNRFQLAAMSNGLIRLTFGEGEPDRVFYRGAFVMTIADAEQVILAIQSSIDALKPKAP